MTGTKEQTYQLILPQAASASMRILAVEAAQALGWASVSMEFPVTCADEVSGRESCRLVRLDEDMSAGEFCRTFCEQLPRETRAVKRPEGYVSATEYARGEQVQAAFPQKSGGLELLSEPDFLLKDTDRDGLPDILDCRFLLPASLDDSVCRAACDLAARFGLDSCGFRCPLVLTEDDGRSNLIVFTGQGEPELVLKQDRPRIIIEVNGSGTALTDFMDRLCTETPLIADGRHLKEAAVHVAEAFAGKNADGQAAAMEGETETIFLSPDASLEAFRGRWPHKRFYHYNDDTPVRSWEYRFAWQADRLCEILEQEIYPCLKAGDTIEVLAAISENRPLREALEREIADKAAARGAQVEQVHVLSAYKQGLSWLEEVFAPQAIKQGRADSAEIEFLLREADGQAENMHPPRWLQELYPADELIAPVLGISPECVVFKGGEYPFTYRAAVRNADVGILWQDAYEVRTSERPYLNEFPQLGKAHPETGYVQVRINNEKYMEWRIPTTEEQIWQVYQEELLPGLREYITNKDAAPAAENQPFFSRLELSVYMGGVERKLGGNDLISSGECLHEELFLAGSQYLRELGKELCGKAFEGPGIVLPLIHYRSGPPQMTAVLKAQYAKEPSAETMLRAEQNAGAGKASPVTAVCTRMTSGPDGLELWFSLSGRSETAAGRGERAAPLTVVQEKMLDSLVRLTDEGFTELAKMLRGYGAVYLNGRRAGLPAKETAKRHSRIGDVDLRPGRIEDVDLHPGRPIGYEEYRRILAELARVPGITIWRMGRSYLGREIFALMPENPRRGYTSRTKLLRRYPTFLVNGRHHANEVSATNAAFALVKKILTDSQYRQLFAEVNLLIIPIENADSAALHSELAEEHPDWQFHSCYKNVLGADLMPEYFKDETIHSGAKVFTRIMREWRPDVLSDLHGVPHHEMKVQFGALNGYRGLWLPRAALCAFYYHVDAPEFASNAEMNQRWAAAVKKAYAGWPEFLQKNQEMERRFRKYSWNGIDECYPSRWDGGFLNYWIPCPYNTAHPYASVSHPEICTVMFTAEAADETAQGEWLELCAEAHLRHVLAGLDSLRRASFVTETIVEGTAAEAAFAEKTFAETALTEAASVEKKLAEAVSAECMKPVFRIRSMRHRPLLLPEMRREAAETKPEISRERGQENEKIYE